MGGGNRLTESVRSAVRRASATTKKSWTESYGTRPVPLRRVETLDRLLPGTNPLMPPVVEESGVRLKHEALSRELRDRRFGAWSLGVDSLNFLQDLISSAAPRFVLELGSGVSTVCLGRYLQDGWGPGEGERILAIEQDEDQSRRSRALVEAVGLSDIARVETVALRSESPRTNGESYDVTVLKQRLGGRRADLVFIDGPSGPPGIRAGTLPAVLPFLADDAWFVLDDAFRSAELRIARGWTRLPDVEVHGVVCVDKGLLIGRVIRQRKLR